ncbi:DUF3883 domain-containing protein [Niastella sp. OAS944]|uniref:DUF3883 domain-containing protein n=1 Tax=Niastella sp. OAS944 TaxID=2664089 RepID=UPI0034809AB3|nr:hypothetical protein [Chitinophagaceae bacterium OAS944]
MSFKSEIQKLINDNLQTYQQSHDRFIADYKHELELTKEYNGRQLLELLQNADDVGSDRVRIEWNKVTQKLIISNKGNPFQVGGIKSLMLANLSTKISAGYIGNKGLGFRSILNWAKKVEIRSNGCLITFSPEIATDVFENQLKLSEQEKQDIRKKYGLTQQTIPLPILAVPSIEEIELTNEWTTSIEIKYYKDFEEDIHSQLKELKEEILLFLNNIQSINIQENEGSIVLGSQKELTADYEIIQIKEKKWRVFSLSNVLPDIYQDKSKEEKQSYNLKVAFQENLSDNYKKLFNFFPTQVSISLPAIIHGTFELNSSRNHLNDSKKNEYILKELVELLRHCAIFLTKEKVDWRPYKLLTPVSKSSDSKLIEDFYTRLEDIKKTESIYPCIYNHYNDLINVVYYSEEFNGFMQQHFGQYFPEMLIPTGNQIDDTFNGKVYEHYSFVERINDLSGCIADLHLRAELIVQMANNNNISEDQGKFSLLVNEASEIISKDSLAFTPAVRSDEMFSIPKSVKIDFMKLELYDLLIGKLESRFDKSELRSRELQRIIKRIVNIQPYDSNNVIEKIITGTKDALKVRKQPEQLSIIQEMVSALYANYKTLDNKKEKINLVAPPLISKSRAVVDSDELFLSETYPAGEIITLIYENHLSDDEYLAEVNYWNLNPEEDSLIENFFIWLGVNKFSQTYSIAYKDDQKLQSYVDFLFDRDVDYSEDFRVSRISKDLSLTGILNFETIRKLKLSHIILLALKDSVIRLYLEQNEQTIDWQYNYWRKLYSQFSYIRYQFISSGLFVNYILEEGSEQLNKLINNDFLLDYSFFENLGFNKAEVKAILIKLGAKESFDELKPESIYNILHVIPQKDESKSGRLTQTIYKAALDSLVKQNSNISVPQKLLLYAKKGDNGAYLPNNEIFYSDNPMLPQKILNTLPILNLQKRAGEDHVEQYLGVKSLRGFKVTLNESKLQLSAINDDINIMIEDIKPFLLAYRFSSPNVKKSISDVDTKKREAKLLKQFKINIVVQCYFKFGDSEEITVEEKEFINIDDTFYYKTTAVTTAESLKKNSLFCDAFAEMMCIIFKVNDLKNDFRQLFRNDLHDTIHVANQDLGKDKIDEAYNLLGISRTEINFWKNIFRLKQKHLEDFVDNFETLKQKVRNSLGINLSANYSKADMENFSNKESFDLICQLCRELNLQVNQILLNGLLQWHRAQYVAGIKDLEFVFNQLLWEKLRDNVTEQKYYIAILNKYKNGLINEMKEIIDEGKYQLTIEYQKNLKTEILSRFHINLDQESLEKKTISNLYNKLLQQYKIEEIDLPEEIRSLLYFEGNSSVIEECLKQQLSSDGNKDDSTERDELIGELFNASITKNTTKVPWPSSPSGSNWVHSSLNDKGKKRAGKNAERLVYNTLKSKYGEENVKWVSGNSTTPHKSDQLHYDIEYKNEDGNWKYVEVKSFKEDRFIISGPEKEKGLAEPDKYEIALVMDKTIYMVNDIFQFKKGESFDNNSNFVAYPKDFFFVFNVAGIQSTDPFSPNQE